MLDTFLKKCLAMVGPIVFTSSVLNSFLPEVFILFYSSSTWDHSVSEVKVILLEYIFATIAHTFIFIYTQTVHKM